MHTLDSIHTQKEIFTWDHIYHNRTFGSVRDPYVLEDESGLSYIPCTLIYFRDGAGTRQSKLFSGNFRREPVNYYEDSAKLIETKLSENLFVDPISGKYMVAMSIDDCIFFDYDSLSKKLPEDVPVVFRAEDGFEWAEKNSPTLLMENELTEQAKGKCDKLGLYGSIPLNLESGSPDIDFLVYGKDEYNSVTSYFKELQEMNVAGLKTPAEYKQMLVDRYTAQFNISQLIANKIISEKPKFLTDKGTVIAFDVARPLENYKRFDTILQTTEVREICVDGTITGAEESYFFPRVYQIEANSLNEPIKVISHRFAAIRSAIEGDDVTVFGMLRRNKNGEHQIFLENGRHYLLPHS